MMPLYYLLYKPRGCVTARRDAVQPTVMDFVPRDPTDHLHPVGRLDKDTEGLLLLTDDGALDNFLLRPDRHVPKTYVFLAFGHLTDADADTMSRGVMLSGSRFVTDPARCEITGYRTVGECADELPAERRTHYLKNPDRPVTAGRVVVRQGHKHQVRLMVKAVGGHVFYLCRTALGPLTLDGLHPGEYRTLMAADLDALGYVPGQTAVSMRRFDVCQDGTRLGTLFYGKTLTYLPDVRPADFPGAVEPSCYIPVLKAPELPFLQDRVRSGDRDRAHNDPIIALPGDRITLYRCGRVTVIDPDTLSPLQKEYYVNLTESASRNA